MNGTLRIILTTLGATLTGAWLVYAVCFMPDRKVETMCKAVRIERENNKERPFFTERELIHLLREAGVWPEGKRYGEITTQAIEDATMQLPVLRRAECYKLGDGTICLRVSQRRPKLRVMSGENYYVDSDRKVLKATFRTACRVPVVTGKVTTEYATGELYDFVCWIERNAFWNAQIEQINITEHQEVELIPRVGGHVIRIGNLEDYERKLGKLETFYEKGYHRTGWKAYRELDLRYNGQIVGKK